MSGKKLLQEQKWILTGIPVLFLVGAFMHFLYDLSGKNILIGLIAPVNESLWEHLKMVILPVILWWTVYYIAAGTKNSIDKNRWFTGALAALLTSLITVPLMYYFYTGAFGKDILAVDILILFLAILFGQLLGLHVNKYSNGISICIPLFIFIGLILIFAIFTLYPPHLPIFKDSLTGQYGITFRREY